MYIQVQIAYELDDKPFSKLGYAYNRAMKLAEDWVLFLDPDIFLLNKDWYKMCMRAISEVGHRAGIITCKMNRQGNRYQQVPDVRGLPDDLTMHYDIAQELYKKHGDEVIDVTDKARNFGGSFMLTHKKAWQDAGGFREDVAYLQDTLYSKAIRDAGYKIYLLPGLYIYHACWRKYPRIPASMGSLSEDRLKEMLRRQRAEERLQE